MALLTVAFTIFLLTAASAKPIDWLQRPDADVTDDDWRHVPLDGYQWHAESSAYEDSSSEFNQSSDSWESGESSESSEESSEEDLITNQTTTVMTTTPQPDTISTDVTVTPPPATTPADVVTTPGNVTHPVTPTETPTKERRGDN